MEGRRTCAVLFGSAGREVIVLYEACCLLEDAEAKPTAPPPGLWEEEERSVYSCEGKGPVSGASCWGVQRSCPHNCRKAKGPL